MKKILLFLTFIINVNYCFAIDEVTLPKQNLNLNYLSKLYYGEIEDFDKVSPLIKLFTKQGITFENSKINSIKAVFVYSGQLNFTKTEHKSFSAIHDFNTVEPMICVKFNDNKTKAMFDINLTRNEIQGHSNLFTQKISQLYVSHNLSDNQSFLIGQGPRLPNSYDGALTSMTQDFILKSQLGRTLGDARAVGIRNIASYKYIDYDIGIYDSSRYMKHFGNGLDFTGFITLKPFSDIETISDNLKIGGGYSIGKNDYSYHQYSFFTGYDYKKFHIKAEYANADGYNGIYNSLNDASGFYTSVAFDLTPKITFLGRYDYFTPSKNIDSSNIQEYTAGITYKVFKNMKIMMNFIRRNYSNKPDSNMILFATRFII